MGATSLLKRQEEKWRTAEAPPRPPRPLPVRDTLADAELPHPPEDPAESAEPEDEGARFLQQLFPVTVITDSAAPWPARPVEPEAGAGGGG